MNNNTIIFKPDPQYLAVCTAAATFMVQWFHYPQKCISYTACHWGLYLWKWPLFGKKIGKWDSCIVIIYIPRNTCIPTFMDFFAVKNKFFKSQAKCHSHSLKWSWVCIKMIKLTCMGSLALIFTKYNFPPTLNPGTHGQMWGNNKTKMMQSGIVVCLFIICIGNWS